MTDVHVVEDNDENSSNGAETGPSTSQILVEFRLCDTKGSDVHKFFFVQFVNGRKTDVRKCIKCSTFVKCPNSGTCTSSTQRVMYEKSGYEATSRPSALQYPIAKIDKKEVLTKSGDLCIRMVLQSQWS